MPQNDLQLVLKMLQPGSAAPWTPAGALPMDPPGALKRAHGPPAVIGESSTRFARYASHIFRKFLAYPVASLKTYWYICLYCTIYMVFLDKYFGLFYEKKNAFDEI